MIQDTSFIVDLLRGNDDAADLLEIVEKEGRPQKVSSVTVLELYEGVADLGRQRHRPTASSTSSTRNTSSMPTTR